MGLFFSEVGVEIKTNLGVAHKTERHFFSFLNEEAITDYRDTGKMDNKNETMRLELTASKVIAKL